MANARSEYEEIRKTGFPLWFSLNKTLGAGTTPSAWHEQLEIKYMISGRMSVVCDSRIMEARAGDLIVVNPYERHFTDVADGETAKYHLFMADLAESSTGAMYRQTFAKYLDESRRFRGLIRSEELSALFLDMVRAYDPDDGRCFMRVYARFLLFFARLEELGADNGGAKKRHIEALSGRDTAVAAALEYVYQHYAEQISVDRLAELGSVSKEHFCRIFKRATGKTPGAFISELRMNKAGVLLAHTDLAVSEVAAGLGYDDNSYFSRRFKQYYGVSPTEYREGERDEEA